MDVGLDAVIRLVFYDGVVLTGFVFFVFPFLFFPLGLFRRYGKVAR